MSVLGTKQTQISPPDYDRFYMLSGSYFREIWFSEINVRLWGPKRKQFQVIKNSRFCLFQRLPGCG
jgi:hypothetical protein